MNVFLLCKIAQFREAERRIVGTVVGVLFLTLSIEYATFSIKRTRFPTRDSALDNEDLIPKRPCQHRILKVGSEQNVVELCLQFLVHPVLRNGHFSVERNAHPSRLLYRIPEGPIDSPFASWSWTR